MGKRVVSPSAVIQMAGSVAGGILANQQVHIENGSGMYATWNTDTTRAALIQHCIEDVEMALSARGYEIMEQEDEQT